MNRLNEMWLHIRLPDRKQPIPAVDLSDLFDRFDSL
jgi:signal transduction histidine kinase